MTVSVPVRVPVVVGVNWTPTVQLAPAARELEQVPSPPEEKSPAIALVAKVSVPVPIFVKVTNCVELVVPSVWFPKLSDVGEKLTVGAPVI